MRKRIHELDLEIIVPPTQNFLRDVWWGLSQPKRSLPCKYFYDEAGAFLFDRICQTEEYYVTRSELSVMRDYAREMAQEIGEDCLLLEYGSGSGEKTSILLDNLSNPAAYVPIDIFPEYLNQTLRTFSELYPNLEVLPLCADFTDYFEIPKPSNFFNRKLIYFPGSTIGNFSGVEAVQLLEQMRGLCEENDKALIGIDLKKDAKILTRAYNDKDGVTAAFNLNILKRINRELGADFRLEGFRHHAFYNSSKNRIEMHLISVGEQTVEIEGLKFYFSPEESIQTEFSHKYDLRTFNQLAQLAGFKINNTWMDREQFFAVVLLEPGQ